MTAAANLLARAASLLPREHDERLELLPILAAALGESGKLPEARSVLAGAVELAQARGNRRVEWRARVAEAWWRWNVDPVGSEEIEALARRAIEELGELGDDFGLAYAWRLHGDAANMRGDGEAWTEGVRRAFEHARRAGNRHDEWFSLSILGGAMFFGPTPVTEGISRLEAIRAEVGDDLLLESAIARALGGFVAYSGRIDEGWRLIERSRSIMADLGMRWGLASIAFMSGRVAMISGDLERAEREYRASAEAYAEMGERGRKSTIVADLAEVVYKRGRLDEAESLAEEAASLTSPDDVSTQAPSLSVRGLVSARRGDVARGERLVRDALALLNASDHLDHRALTLLNLAEVLELAGRADEAMAAVEKALELTRQKGNVLLERRAMKRLEEIGA